MCGYPLLEQNLLSADIKEYVVRSQTISRCTARVFRQVNSAPHRFAFPVVDLVLLDCKSSQFLCYRVTNFDQFLFCPMVGHPLLVELV